LAANRAALDKTLSALEQRISLEGLFHEAMERLRNENGTEFLRGLRDSVVHNPLPVTLAAIGLAWTAFSDRNTRAGSSGDGQGKTAGVAHQLDTAKTRGREWAGRSGEAMGNVRERAGELGQSAAERTRRSAEQTRDLAREYPIIMVGTGLVLGAALAALLPATQIEREKLGPARDRAMREVRKAADATVTGAKEGVKEESAASGPGEDRRGEDRRRQPEAGLRGSGDDGSSGGSPHIRTPGR
jgi:ElaB/YqjD/DUF883 family membrane-anchored ribosome-binding protein